MKTETLELSNTAPQGSSPAVAPSPISILEAAIRSGVTSESVAVVKELVQLCREQRAEDAKAAFAKAFFQLRKNMPTMYADREAKDRSGNAVYRYCSEEEISKGLEPHLMSYGFAMLFGQTAHDGHITVNVTLMHEGGHSETREFTVRSGSPNAMKDAAMCDSGAATSAWRHLMMKMFGLKSRIQTNQDASVAGDVISKDKALYLRERVTETGSDEKIFLLLAGVEASAIPAPIADYEKIHEDKYDMLVAKLASKEKKNREAKA